jgi:hypothetical protein
VLLSREHHDGYIRGGLLLEVTSYLVTAHIREMIIQDDQRRSMLLGLLHRLLAAPYTDHFERRHLQRHFDDLADSLTIIGNKDRLTHAYSSNLET